MAEVSGTSPLSGFGVAGAVGPGLAPAHNQQTPPEEDPCSRVNLCARIALFSLIEFMLMSGSFAIGGGMTVVSGGGFVLAMIVATITSFSAGILGGILFGRMLFPPAPTMLSASAAATI